MNLKDLLFRLDFIDGYCDVILDKSSSAKKSPPKKQYLASVFPDKETMEQVMSILRDQKMT